MCESPKRRAFFGARRFADLSYDPLVQDLYCHHLLVRNLKCTNRRITFRKSRYDVFVRADQVVFRHHRKHPRIDRLNREMLDEGQIIRANAVVKIMKEIQVQVLGGISEFIRKIHHIGNQRSISKKYAVIRCIDNGNRLFDYTRKKFRDLEEGD